MRAGVQWWIAVVWILGWEAAGLLSPNVATMSQWWIETRDRLTTPWDYLWVAVTFGLIFWLPTHWALNRLNVGWSWLVGPIFGVVFAAWSLRTNPKKADRESV